MLKTLFKKYKIKKGIFISIPVIVALLFGIYVIMGTGIIRGLSPTYDEPIHLFAGSIFLKTANYHMSSLLYLPPLSEMIAALPIVLCNKSIEYFNVNAVHVQQVWQLAQIFLYHNPEMGSETLLVLGRLSLFLVCSSFLLWGIFSLAREISDTKTAIIALIFCVFSPSILGYGTLITPDFALTCLFFLTIFMHIRLFKTKTIRYALLAGALQGAAITAKASAVILPLVIIVQAAFLFITDNTFKRHIKNILGLLVISQCVSILIISAVYRCVHVHYFFQSFVKLLQHNTAGHPAFLMGAYSTDGWWYYYVVTFIIKTPLPLLLLIILYGIFLFMDRKNDHVLRKPDAIKNLILLGTPIIVLFIVASISKIQIGHRYILPLYPFLFILAGITGRRLYRSYKGRIILGFMICWYVGGSLCVYPFSLSYCNELVGGAKRGYHYLVDSNNDWGQGLRALADYIKQQGVNSIYLSYFGNGDPAYYGIQYIPIHFKSVSKRRGHDVNPMNEKKVLFVISATNYQGVYFENHDEFLWLKKFNPAEIIAGSLLVFDITDNDEAKNNLLCILKNHSAY